MVAGPRRAWPTRGRTDPPVEAVVPGRPGAGVRLGRGSERARFLLAWTVVDEALSVERVARLAGAVEDGRSPEAAFDELGVRAGRIRVGLPAATYRELHRRASLEGVEPDAVVAAALRRRFD